ncbi:MAG: hypothetical protein ABI480_11180 [Chitinophagaceae bacterium]
MFATSVTEIETMIKNYIEHKEKSMVYGKKRLDAEKEYNKLLTKYDGEAKHYSLEQANNIYKAYLEMIANGEESELAKSKFAEAEEKLREVGQILFEATINAEIAINPINGDSPSTRPVTVKYYNGQVIVS